MFDRNKKTDVNFSQLLFVDSMGLWLIFLLAMWAPISVIAEEVLSANDAFVLAERQEIILIDIRSEKEWKETGVASVARPISMYGPQFLARFKSVSKEANGRPIALICATGGRSAWLKKELSTRGIRNIVDVTEGMLGNAAGPGWISEGLPVVPYTKSPVSKHSGELSLWERISGRYKPLWLNDE